MWRDLRTTIGVIAALILIPCGVIALFGVGWGTYYTAGITFEEPPPKPPLAKLSVTRWYGTAKEVFATLSPGVRLEDAVDLSAFNGFDPDMTPEAAAARLGPPTGKWRDPFYRSDASYYDRGDARVSLSFVEASEGGGGSWNTLAYPKKCTHEVFLHPALREQLQAFTPPTGELQVNVLRSLGWGGLTVFMTRGGCERLILTAREG